MKRRLFTLTLAIIWSCLVALIAAQNLQTPDENFNQHQSKSYTSRELDELRDRASKKDWAALVELGDYYAAQRGRNDGLQSAFKCWEKAAKKGYAEAQSRLGDYYITTKEYDKAYKWFKKSAEQGHANGQYGLGWCYFAGIKVKQDYSEAVRWWDAAAHQGHAKALFDLGCCYHNGNGVEKNPEKVAFYWQKAAERGYADAMYNMGHFYLEGYVVEQNYETAAKWFEKAVKAGHRTAQTYLDKTQKIIAARQARQDSIDYAQARKMPPLNWLKRNRKAYTYEHMPLNKVNPKLSKAGVSIPINEDFAEEELYYLMLPNSREETTHEVKLVPVNSEAVRMSDDMPVAFVPCYDKRFNKQNTLDLVYLYTPADTVKIEDNGNKCKYGQFTQPIMLYLVDHVTGDPVLNLSHMLGEADFEEDKEFIDELVAIRLEEIKAEAMQKYFEKIGGELSEAEINASKAFRSTMAGHTFYCENCNVLGDANIVFQTLGISMDFAVTFVSSAKAVVNCRVSLPSSLSYDYSARGFKQKVENAYDGKEYIVDVIYDGYIVLKESADEKYSCTFKPTSNTKMVECLTRQVFVKTK